MANPPLWPTPQGPKNDAGEAFPSPSRPLLRLAKITQKRGFPRRFPDGFPTVLPRFAGSGVPLHPKETVGQFRTHFQAYKPSIWEEESFRRYMESREEALPAGTQRPWWKFWGTG